ncbi:MAG: alpha-2-macroglobulin, partial [Anaerolineae bacterium]
PNVFVSVIIVKGTDETSPVPSFKVGYAALAVSTVEKELQVTITPDKGEGEHYQPRETVTYDIEALDHKGEGVEAEFSLTLVDRSVLALAEERGPSLLDHFWRERGVGIRTATTLVFSIDRVNLEVAPEAKGGGGGEPGAGIVRRRFPDTAYWNPVVRTDENGKAQVSVELPDTLTTWRLGAKAITADTEVGETTVDLVSTKDLLVRPVAPRFFVVGDEAQLSAVVHNNTDEPIGTEISLSAEGLTVEDEAQKKLEVPAHGRGKVTWQTTIGDEKEAVLLYSAKGGKLSDAIEITLPIHRYSSPEVVATAGQLEAEGSRVEVVSLPERFDPSQGELTVEIDPSLAAGMRDGLKYLEAFPYHCIEQIVSRFLPNVMTYRALKKLGIENPELETKLPQYVSIGLQRLYALQHYDGGWGWWLLDDSDPYLTAYVLFGLNETRRADFAVEEEVMEDAADFLRESLGRPADVRQPHKANTQAFILYVLAEYGEGDLGRTVALYQRRENLGNYGKAYLAMALDILAPEERKRVDALVSDLVSSAILSATGAHWEEETIDYWTMNTNTRSTAIVLDALTRLSPDQGIIPNAVRWLMVTRKEGHWETTQETAWSVIALTDYMVSTGELLADYSYQVRLNGEDWGEGTANAENLDEPQKLQVAVADLLRDVSNQIRIDRFKEADQTGEGRLYYAMYLRYFLPVEDIRALDRGVIVARQYSFPDEPEEWIDEAQVGDVIKVKLTIIAPSDLHYLVVEDSLPAGCEALDQSLKTTSVVGQRPELERVDEWDRWGWGWWWFSHTEVRDEKVALFATYLPRGTYEYTYLMRASVPGEFQVIPSLAYQFYFPETFGRSDGAKFTVRPGEE